MTLSMWEQEKYDEGLSQGIDIGRTEGILKTLAGLVRDGFISVVDAASRAGLTEREFTAQTAALGV